MTKATELRTALQVMRAIPPGMMGDHAAWVARQSLSPVELDTLVALVGGPVWDGDLPSKTARDTLVELGLAVKCVAKGQQGYQAATDLGWLVFSATLELAAGAATVPPGTGWRRVPKVVKGEDPPGRTDA